MMNETTLKFIISRLIENANDSLAEAQENKDDLFSSGRKVAYYEMLDIIKSELEAHGQDIKVFGLDIDLEKTFL